MILYRVGFDKLSDGSPRAIAKFWVAKPPQTFRRRRLCNRPETTCRQNTTSLFSISIFYFLFTCAADEAFHAPFKLGAGQEDFAIACGAAQAYFGPQAHNLPCIATTGVGFAQLNNIVEAKFNHVSDK
jgi:hypothetical protein